jgi:Tol biopolymer transport system component
MIRSARPLALAATFFLVFAFSSPAGAQYFGRNKVQYKKLDFQVLKTEHFDIYFYPSEREGIDIAARMAERWHARLQKLFEHELSGRQPLILYASHPDFEQTNAIPGELGEGTGGVTEPLRRRIVLPLAGPLGDTDHVIGHELVHAFQFDIMIGPNAPPGPSAADQIPLWFIEGMAEYFSIGPVDPNTAMWLRDAARQEKLPTIDELDNPKYFPYRWGQAFWAYIGGRFGDGVISRMMATAAASGDLRVVFSDVLGMDSKELSADWQASIRAAYAPILAATTPPAEIGRLALKPAGLGGDMNVGPSISPDGKWIAFFSERSLLSIDLFVADAATGRVVRKITSTATDPHYSSLQFIHSAGAWDAASRRIAIGTVADGYPAIAIFDAQSGDKEREIPLRDIDEVFNPTWAPDGHAIAFTGMTRGLTDLFVYDLQSSTMERLTNDPYAELTPAWSPDGLSIAFATDRFSSDLRTLATGPYQLALINLGTRAVAPVPSSAGGKNINPQWSPDGRSLYFISDRDGISNLYRITLGTGDVAQITRAATGLSGITSSSPALSVATGTGDTVFTVYEDGKYLLHMLDGDARVVPAAPALAGAAVLPPLDRRPSDVVATIADATTGLPTGADFETAEYKRSLSLEQVGQPTIAIGADRFGAAVGGGIAFQFGDMLGDQTLVTAVQLNSGISGNYSAQNTSAQVFYLNSSRRWNWGLVAGQTPYLSGGTQSLLGSTPEGQPVQVDRAVVFRQTERSAAGVLAYPFSRAQRLEWQAGVSRISFDLIDRTRVFSLITGQVLQDDTNTTSLGDALNLATTSMALVYDTTSFGATSPVQGQRYRFEMAPSFGSINVTNVLADYRRYFMPASFYTIAGRMLHYGRYGSGGQDSRLSPLYLGYPNLVRGYDIAPVGVTGCGGTALIASECAAFDQLMGSRMLVGNLEFRFPLLRPFGASQRMYGPLPVEVALFTDGGVAWNRGQRPSFFGGERHGVGSAGLTLRVNLGGYAIGQFDFSHPVPSQGRGWVFQFNLSPGF